MKSFIITLILLAVGFNILAQHGLDDFEKYNDYFKEQDLDNFLTAVQHYEAEKEENFTNRILLANIFLNEFSKNIAALEAEYDSLTVHGKFSLANLLLGVGKFQRSIEIYDELNENYPKWTCPWRHKGEALMKTGRLEEALAATIKSIESREDHYDAYIQLAEIQKELGDYEAALKSLEKGLQHRDTYTEDEITDEDVLNLQKEIEELLNK